MRLKEVRVKNFRCYKDEARLRIGPLTAIVGKNNAGKSTFLEALAIFFEECDMDAGDPCVFGDKKSVEITCVFEALPDEVVLDTDFPTTLASEYLLSGSGCIEVVKRFRGDTAKPKLVGTFLRCNHPSAEGFSDLHALKLNDLKARMGTLGCEKDGVDTKVNSQIRRRIWDSCPDLKVCEQLIAVDSDDAKEVKKVWDRLKNYLPAFALFKSDRPSTDQDAEAQDPLKAAIREALKGQEKILEGVLTTVKDEVLSVARDTLEKLGEMDPSLMNSLTPVVGSKNWDSLFTAKLTGDDDVPVNKHGSGFRRLLLLNFFRANAERKLRESNATSVIYAYEEPETSQHPDNQKLLMRAFAELTEQESCQVILTTHTPMLGGLLPVDSLRYVEIGDGRCRVVHDDGENTYRRVIAALGVLPEHKVQVFVAVEGVNDIEFLRRISSMLHVTDPTVPDLAQVEADGRLIFIPLGGGNLKVWSSRLAGLNRPEFHLYDRDLSPETEKHEDAAREVNGRQNCLAVLTAKRETENYLHPDAIQEALGISISFGDTDDVPALVKNALGRGEGYAKKVLSTSATDRMTEERLRQRDPEGELRGWLLKIGQMASQDGSAGREPRPTPNR
jgi:putative ATP-dependent endonuclease of OLD family